MVHVLSEPKINNWSNLVIVCKLNVTSITNTNGSQARIKVLVKTSDSRPANTKIKTERYAWKYLFWSVHQPD